MIKVENFQITNFSEDGGWFIKNVNNEWAVFEVPLYGGEPILSKKFSNYDLDRAVIYAKTLT